jgi:hypothetical protein
MDLKQILFLIFITAILTGAAYGSGAGDFSVDKTYHPTNDGKYYSLYLNDNEDSGITIYRNVDDDACEDAPNDGGHGDLIHDDGENYIKADDDLQIVKTAGNIIEFEDIDHSEHGVSEVIKKDGSEYIVVIWAKNSSGIESPDLSAILKDFNSKNKVEAAAI